MHAGTVRCWDCEYGYDSVGRASTIVYRSYDSGRALATINIAIEYVNSTQGFASGNVESIELSLPSFSSALKSLKVDFRYDERGLEVQRVYSILGERGSSTPNETKLVFDVINTINNEHLIESQTIIRSYMSGTEVEDWGHYDSTGMKYSYDNLGGGVLSVSSSIQYDDVGSPSTRKSVSQFTFGSSRINELSTNIGNASTRQKYTYIADRVNATTPPKGQVGETALYEYDDNGNVKKDPSFNFLRYNVENALSIYAQTDVTPVRETKYYYSPSGELNRIIDPDGESVYYFYNDNILAGEVTPKLRTHYIQVGNILLGRVLVCPASSTSVNASCELEIFGTDSAGSVRAVYRFTAGATEPVVNYFDYSDYGERTPS
ncbi:hypothetical protein C4K04_4713 [Pseudomonas chlororaphis]|uniref:YD repeat protein n=1 Tax=Pseudomonas chlororaphis TaxID=587753 RepID=A0A3G7TVD7_9PSED|nr:hypothetical protein [Pseudomonas chlororaphis]AZE50368.1 hypothetical protein C4K04_4713 [Pseudomonas chlororaphis]